MSPSSSAVLPPSLATVDKPRPPIARHGILKPGFDLGIAGGRPASESESLPAEESSELLEAFFFKAACLL